MSNLPSQYSFTVSNPKNISAYSIGPMFSGQAYPASGWEGYWGTNYNPSNNQFTLTQLNQLGDSVNIYSTGFTLSYYPEIQSRAANRVSNLSLTFDLNGQPVLAIADNGDTNVGFDNTPQVKVRGSVSANWQGHSPLLFSTLALSGFSNIIGCYYTDSSKQNLYARYSIDGFTAAVWVNSGIFLDQPATPGGFEGLTEPTALIYDPFYANINYSQVMFALDPSRNLTLFYSKFTSGSSGINEIAWLVGITQNVDSQFITIPYNFGQVPVVIVQEQNNSNQNYYFVGTSGVSVTGFYAIYSDTVTDTGLYLNVLASLSGLFS